MTTTSIQLDHIKTRSRSKPITSSISTHNLQHPTDQQLDTKPDNINKHLVFESKQPNKKYSAFLRKRFSPFHVTTTDNTNSNNLQIPINNYLPSNKVPLSLLSLKSKLSKSTAQHPTNLDTKLKNKKIVSDSPVHTLHVSQTPTKYSISTNNNNTSLPYQLLIISNLRILFIFKNITYWSYIYL